MVGSAAGDLTAAVFYGCFGQIWIAQGDTLSQHDFKKVHCLTFCVGFVADNCVVAALHCLLLRLLLLLLLTD